MMFLVCAVFEKQRASTVLWKRRKKKEREVKDSQSERGRERQREKYGENGIIF